MGIPVEPDPFATQWKGTQSEELLNKLWKSTNELSDVVEKCIAHARTIEAKFERDCFLNSVSGHLLSGIDTQRGGFTRFEELIAQEKERT